jgi:chlorophyll synthase
MTLNDFKAIEGDRRMGIGSLPVRLGVRGAALTACAVMLLPQGVVVGLLLHWGAPLACRRRAGAAVGAAG